MELLKKGLYEEKKSKFYSYLYKIENFGEYKEIIEINKKEHKKANHHCYSIIFKSETKITNDSEVGSPGRIIYQYLNQNKLNSHMLIVSRIFGGIKLGQGGVVRAFRKSIDNLDNL